MEIFSIFIESECRPTKLRSRKVILRQHCPLVAQNKRTRVAILTLNVGIALNLKIGNKGKIV